MKYVLGDRSDCNGRYLEVVNDKGVPVQLCGILYGDSPTTQSAHILVRRLNAIPDLLDACSKFTPLFAVLRQYIPGPALDCLEQETWAAITKAKGETP